MLISKRFDILFWTVFVIVENQLERWSGSVLGWFIWFLKATYLPAHQTSVITLQGHVAHTYGGQGELKELVSL